MDETIRSISLIRAGSLGGARFSSTLGSGLPLIFWDRKSHRFLALNTSAAGYAAGDLPGNLEFYSTTGNRRCDCRHHCGRRCGRLGPVAGSLGGSVAQLERKLPTSKGPQKTAPAPTFKIDNSVPKDARNCTSEGHNFYAPPSFNLQAIENAGKSNVFNAFNPGAMNSAVGHYGTFDFQRVETLFGNTTFYSAYTPVSNVAVGAYLYSSGYTKLGASAISNTFALFKSKNAGDPNQALYRNIGVDLAAGKAKVTCLPK